MQHLKQHRQINHETKYGPIVIEGPIQSSDLEKYEFHEDLTAFRPAPRQLEALLEIADFPEGRILIARTSEMIIGYMTFVHPDPIERWSEIKMDDLIELGAVEIIPNYRGQKVASKLLKVALMDDYMENYIVFSTEFYWHWDLEGSGLNVWEYRKLMEKMMAVGGLKPQTTDDPEIISHPANSLVVRIGKNVPKESIEKFDELRFLDRNRRKRRIREG
ncbi:MAG TPA: GNAT family N-acetyltransferase [Bacillota bacterium]|nr:GNAT family N-acetyltransferase [Bacillota bacterium]